MLKYTLNQGTSNPSEAGFRGNTNLKLPVVNWLADLPETQLESDLVEVQFKNSRKGYYVNVNKLLLEKGDKVAVEASPGHDIGEVTLTGRLVVLQIKKNGINMERYAAKRLYRKARLSDMEKYEETKAKEHPTMIKARQITQDLNLEMKIGDVEYQGDGGKAIFYYIADGRVDFRQLIKVLAEVLKVRIEMKQIGARQEAGRIGGIGPCGRELCCALWINNFISVSTTSARLQDISTNPLKLAGQCAKIKCCVNYEVPVYMEASADFPNRDTILKTADSDYYCIKVDVFKRLMTYSSSPNGSSNVKTISVDRAKEIIKINESGKSVDSLLGSEADSSKTTKFRSATEEDSITRFDKKRKYNHNNQQKPQYQNRSTQRINHRNKNTLNRRFDRNNDEENSIQTSEFKREN